MYLIDTNIFLEYILSRSHVQEVKDFFSRADLSKVHVSDFSLHSLGVIYLREHKFSEFLTFVNEDIMASGIHVLSLVPDDFSKITDAAKRFHLDFDDAYQYALAERYGLSIVSFDKDFDRTERGRVVPEDLFRSSQ
ncbi:PIN domain-containing protein [Methanoregula sp.]|uniref:type II toxin-antitoxin system VapC family toxin n=1 Tax=Methanoregula sp. TaxID=2052170 RepID=UPI002372633C|nr:PIN domain-containing protein [Methanoregula sp.]MDD1686033.1 PIN domain-containing protein [Methanoregula sp.]